MSLLPIIEHQRADPPHKMRKTAARLAEQLPRELPYLTVEEQFQPLVPAELIDAPTLHLDDLSEIPMLDGGLDVCFMQDRARLRADDGDVIATCSAPVAAFEDYCRDHLGLGSPEWLYPAPLENRLRVSTACLRDRSVRRKLIHELRCGDLLYIHPHMGSFSVWEMAALLHQSSRWTVKVIAPPPGLSRWVNDKIAFAQTITRLYGEEFIPRTAHADNLALLSKQVEELAANSRVIAVKLPDSAGGGGNVVIDAERFQGRSLHAIREILQDHLSDLTWDGVGDLLVGSWEADVLAAPSVQTWIPPLSAGPPLIEGLYSQTIEGREGFFVGSQPGNFPDELQREMIDRSWLLAWLYQRLGYVGRCSFDLLLVGNDWEHARLEFIECNGRWGGTSVPMTLVNRLCGDWVKQPYAARECYVPGLDQIDFDDLLNLVGNDLYDARTGQGTIVLYNPGRMHARSGINVLALGNSWSEAALRVRESFPRKLRKLISEGDKD